MTIEKRLGIAFLLLLGALSSATAQSFSEITKRLDSLYLTASYFEGEQLSRATLSSTSLTQANQAELTFQLGTFTQELGKYAIAEDAYLKAYSYFVNSGNAEPLLTASILSNLSVLYAEQGRYDAARNAARRQYEIYTRELGKQNGFTAMAAVVLSKQYISTREYDSARALLQEIEPVVLNQYGRESKEAARLYEALGKYYFSINEFHASEDALIKARASAKNTPGDRHPLTARIAISLARTRLTLGNTDSALQNVNDALTIALKASGPTHPFTAECWIAKGSILEAQSKYAEAFSAFSSALDIFREATKENFRYTSERERLSFLALVGEEFARIGSATIRASAIYPQATQVYYDALLFQKGIVITSLQSQTKILSRSGDSSTLLLLDNLATLRTRRSRLARATLELPEHTLTTIDSIETSLNKIEKELAKKSSFFTGLSTLKKTKWQDVQRAIAKKEIGIELSKFPYYDGERRTDTSFYTALTLGEYDSTRPRIAILGIAEKIEDSTVIRQYFQAMDKRSKKAIIISALVTKVLWSGLEGYLGDANSIVISPDGIYHQISLAPLRNIKGELLLERYNFRYVTSTRDILASDVMNDTVNSFVAFGAPNFDYSPNKNIERINTSSPISQKESTSLLEALPNSSNEVIYIGEEFKKVRYSVELHLDTDATEVQFRQLTHPKVLHIATHAAFADAGKRESILTLGTDQEIETPLLSSRLYLAGANKTLLSNSASSDPNNDGVVNALEASEIDLNGTDLVTISACESGRGAVQPGEGVYGLTRAFLIAGARNVLLSLWQVPDRETRELMIRFYRELLSGKSKAEALRNAELSEREIVRKRYGEDRPSHWAAFVLIGAK